MRPLSAMPEHFLKRKRPQGMHHKLAQPLLCPYCVGTDAHGARAHTHTSATNRAQKRLVWMY